jgi:predicted lipid-binding transport protein (Tim44 family)
MNKKMHLFLVFSTLFVFGMATVIESSAWARAGGGGSAGNRGSRSFSSPQMPSSPSSGSTGLSTPGRNPSPAGPTQPSGGLLSRSPFMQGLAGGLAGGMIGNLLFGGMGHASPGGVAGGGIGFFEIALLGLLLYLAYRFFKKRRVQNAPASAYYADGGSPQPGVSSSYLQTGTQSGSIPASAPAPGYGEPGRGLDHIKRNDPAFREETFKETVQDLFFRIQAGWTNRSLDGIEGILTYEMATFFRRRFESMGQKGLINRLENIAIRRVELAEAWQEAGKDYVTVLITANLLDYVVDAATRKVVEGDKLNPVKFQELWTLCRDIGSARWQLSAINQVEH